MRRRRARYLVIGATILLALSSCQTQRHQAIGLEPTAHEVQRASDEILERYGGTYDDAALQAYVEAVGRRVLAATPLPPASVRFVLIDTDAVNAYAVPGATVFLTRGLFAWLNSEAELAGVIAHELAHIAERHVAQARQAERAAADRAQARGAFRPGPAAEASLTEFSRGQELEADLIGLGYLVAAGYPGRAMGDNLRQFQAVDLVARAQRGISDGWPGGAEAMTTHPSSSERQAALAAAPQSAAEGEARRDAYLSAIDGLAFGPRGDDWRVQDGRMIHHSAGIEFLLPEGYALASSAGVLSGTGPEHRALVIDFVARDSSTSPAAYLDRRFGRSGASPAESRVIGGFPAAVIGLERQEQAGPRWRALLATIEIDRDALMRIISIAPAGAGSTEADAFEAVAGSLRQHAPGGAAPVRRLAILRVGPDETVAALVSGSEVLDELMFRAVNGLAPDAQPAPGQLVKLVE